MNLLRNAAIVSIVTETVSIESPFPSLSKSSAMWCEAYVQTLRLALLPAELSFSKMPKSQKLKMHRTQNSQRKVDWRREKDVNDFDQRSLYRTSLYVSHQRWGSNGNRNIRGHEITENKNKNKKAAVGLAEACETWDERILYQMWTIYEMRSLFLSLRKHFQLNLHFPNPSKSSAMWCET